MPKAPTENREIDLFNPLEIAEVGFKKSMEMLQWLLGRKEDLMSHLKPSGPKQEEQFAVAKESVNRRHVLVGEMNLV